MKYLHTMIRIKNVDESLKFFCEGLGLKETRRMEDEKGRYTLIFLAAPNDDKAEIELTYNWDKKSEDYELGDKYGHIAIGVKDIHLICQGLENNGCKVTTKPKTMKNSNTVLAFIEDPDGYKIELIERD